MIVGKRFSILHASISYICVIKHVRPEFIKTVSIKFHCVGKVKSDTSSFAGVHFVTVQGSMIGPSAQRLCLDLLWTLSDVPQCFLFPRWVDDFTYQTPTRFQSQPQLQKCTDLRVMTDTQQILCINPI